MATTQRPANQPTTTRTVAKRKTLAEIAPQEVAMARQIDDLSDLLKNEKDEGKRVTIMKQRAELKKSLGRLTADRIGSPRIAAILDQARKIENLAQPQYNLTPEDVQYMADVAMGRLRKAFEKLLDYVSDTKTVRAAAPSFSIMRRSHNDC